MSECDTKQSVSNNDDSGDRLNCDMNIDNHSKSVNDDKDTTPNHVINLNKPQFGEISSMSTDTPSPMSISADSGNFGAV